MTKNKVSTYVEYIGGSATLLLLFSIAFSRALMHISVGILAVAALVYGLSNGTAKWREAAPAWSLRTLFLFYAALIISIVLSDNPELGFEHLPLFAYFLATPLFFLPFTSLPQVKKWGATAFVAGFLLGLIVIFANKPVIVDTVVRYRPHLSIMDYGGTLGIAYPVALLFFVRTFNRPNKIYTLLAGILCFLLVVAAMYNGTRAIWGSLIVSTVFVALLTIRHLRWQFLLYVIVSIFFVYGFTRGYPVFRENVPSDTPEVAAALSNGNTAELSSPSPARKSEEDQLLDMATPNPLDDPSVSIRLKLWEDSFKKWVAHPVFGIGYANTPFSVMDKNQDIIGQIYAFKAHCHNTFLQIATETGFFGLLTYIGLAIPSLGLVFSNLRSKDENQRFWAKVLLSVIVAFAVHSMSDYVFDIKTVIYLFAFMITLCWQNLNSYVKKLT